ncbi:hypothetical protein AB0323_14805 [Arthrobacter sp. NPDC080031]|uniref:hypothetical protein n=1 Tax=Arthrobacter sp. NPDC080031 TaxID=3155918 RepID=UPI00344DDD01
MRLNGLQESDDFYGRGAVGVVLVVAVTDGVGLAGADGVGLAGAGVAGGGGADWVCVTVGTGAGRPDVGATVGGTVTTGGADTVGVDVTTGACVLVGACVTEGPGVPLAVLLGVRDALGEGFGAALGVPVGVAVGLGVALGVAVGVGLGVPVGGAVGVALGLGVPVGDAVGVCVPVADGLGGITFVSCTPPVTACPGGAAPGSVGTAPGMDQTDPAEVAVAEPGW